MILAADVGGTKTHIGLFDCATPAADGRDAPTKVVDATFPSADYSGLEAIVARFFETLEPRQRTAVRAAAFGVAGPVTNGRSVTPNLPWVIDSGALSEAFGLPKLALLNDLVATALGVAALLPSELHTLSPGSRSPEAPGDDRATRALVAPGTGLGVASLVWAGEDWRVLPSEGGHADFAPRDAAEAALLAFLSERFPGHVSAERILSGRGLLAVYEFLTRGSRTSNPQLDEAVERGDPAAPRLVSERALAGDCAVCVEALDWFCGVLGAFAGNFVLGVLATGGLYLGGGIPPKILPALERPPFLEAFLAKGRLRGLLETVPIHLITNPEAALLGAARHAATLAGSLE